MRNALPLLLLLAACQTSPTKELELRTYRAPEGYAEQLRPLLNNVLNTSNDPAGRATLAPDGQLIVVGSSRIQEGVASMIAQLPKSASVAAPNAVEMSYWLVLGKTAQEMSVPPALAEIRSALEATGGKQAFGEVEHLKLVSNVSEHGEALGRAAHIEQTVWVSGGKVIGELRFEPVGPHKLHTRVTLAPDQTLVLGETGFEYDQHREIFPAGDPDFAKGDDVRLYYVVRAAIRDAARP